VKENKKELTEEQKKILIDFHNKIVDSQIDMEPEMIKILDDNFWESLA
jgi:hypothetical protein